MPYVFSVYIIRMIWGVKKVFDGAPRCTSACCVHLEVHSSNRVTVEHNQLNSSQQRKTPKSNDPEYATTLQ